MHLTEVSVSAGVHYSSQFVVLHICSLFAIRSLGDRAGFLFAGQFMVWSLTLQSACGSVPGQKTGPQIALDVSSFSVWVCVWMLIAPDKKVAPCRVASATSAQMNAWLLTCVAKCLEWRLRLEKWYMNAVYSLFYHNLYPNLWHQFLKIYILYLFINIFLCLIHCASKYKRLRKNLIQFLTLQIKEQFLNYKWSLTAVLMTQPLHIYLY